MTKFLRLTIENSASVLVAAAAVTSLEETADGKTWIMHSTTGRCHYVEETPEQIMAMIGAEIVGAPAVQAKAAPAPPVEIEAPIKAPHHRKDDTWVARFLTALAEAFPVRLYPDGVTAAFILAACKRTNTRYPELRGILMELTPSGTKLPNALTIGQVFRHRLDAQAGGYQLATRESKSGRFYRAEKVASAPITSDADLFEIVSEPAPAPAPVAPAQTDPKRDWFRRFMSAFTLLDGAADMPGLTASQIIARCNENAALNSVLAELTEDSASLPTVFEFGFWTHDFDGLVVDGHKLCVHRLGEARRYMVQYEAAR
jgi:hypothetical protein